MGIVSCIRHISITELLYYFIKNSIKLLTFSRKKGRLVPTDQITDSQLLFSKLESLISLGLGEHRIVCPFCSQYRIKRTKRDFSVTVKVDCLLYYCHHCGAKGRIRR